MTDIDQVKRQMIAQGGLLPYQVYGCKGLAKHYQGVPLKWNFTKLYIYE